MYTVVGVVGIPLRPGCCMRHAGSSDILLSFVIMRMDSFILCFAVRDGSKTTSSPRGIIAL